MGGFTVDPATLQAQAAMIEANISSILQECLEAAKHADQDDDGQLGLLVTPIAWLPLMLLNEQACTSIEATLQLSQGLAQALDGVSQCYAGMDDGIASALDKIAAEVEE